MRIFITVLLLASNIILYSCSDVNGISEPDQERTIDWVIQNRPQDLVAVTAMFLNEDENKPWKVSSAIVLVDFYNTRNYKIITDSSMIAGYTRFSREKRKLLYSDVYHGTYDIGDQFVVYDVAAETSQHLFYPSGLELMGELPVWDYDATGFFYTKEPSFGFQYIRYYHIADQHWETISGPDRPSETGYANVYPIGLKGQDTLIVFSNITHETGQPYGKYLMDLEGNYISRINNPYIEKGVTQLNWNDLDGLFVFGQEDSTFSGRRISITDMYGDIYKTFTSGSYYDEYPVWGPQGEYILFTRWANKYKTGLSKIMIINVKTGDVRDYLQAGDIPGVIKFNYPDF